MKKNVIVKDCSKRRTSSKMSKRRAVDFSTLSQLLGHFDHKTTQSYLASFGKEKGTL